MKSRYDDITSLTTMSPKWWTSSGVPRYVDFDPKCCSNVYASEVVLLKIACQGCGTEFDVEVAWDEHQWHFRRNPRLSEQGGEIFYGDPPDSGCCPAGPTMSSISLKILQFWKRGRNGWERAPELEGRQIEKLEDYFETDEEK